MITRFSQFSRFFTKLGGCRKKTPNSDLDFVTVHCWEQSIFIPSKHCAIEITKKSVSSYQESQTFYLSFAPLTLRGLDAMTFSELRIGRDSVFEETLADEQLARGYRRAYLNEDLSNKNYHEILHAARKLPNSKQDELRTLGAPDQSIVLRSLDLDIMIQEIQSLKEAAVAAEEKNTESKTITTPQYKSKWASWASAFWHEPETHSCASIVLSVLYKGGLGKLVQTSYQDVSGLMGFFLGAGLFIGNANYLNATINLLKIFFTARAMGGAYEGWSEVQSLIDLDAAQKTKMGQQPSSLTAIGLRLTIVTLSSLVSLLKTGPFYSEWFLATPQGVMDRVVAAKKEEDAIYLPEARDELVARFVR